MQRRRLVFFVILPVTVGLVLQALYFSNVDPLEQIIVPRMTGMHVNTWREFGLVENIQNLLLLGILALAIAGIRRKPRHWEKGLFAFVAALALFVLLEEIDYGLHYYELAMGIGAEEAADTRNWHNVGKRTSTTKRLVDTASVIWFFLLPLAMARVRSPRVRYFLPGRWYAATVVCAWLLSELAHALNDAGLNPDGNIRANISEFREINTYYLPLLYLWEMVYLRRWPGDALESGRGR